jgi:TPR repeat protein
MYRDGEGVSQNDKTAVKWYTLAAEQGNANAQISLGVMYAKGDGVLQDFATARKWFTLAAEQGDEYAQYNLGVMYYNGEGVLEDYVYAHMWASFAAANGYEHGGELRDDVAKAMTPSQIQEAQTLARECVAKNYKNC